MDTNCYARENADGTMYYPPTLPKPRDNLLLIYGFAPMALYFAVGCYIAEQTLSFILLVLLFLSAMFVNELMHIVKQFFHERQYLISRYKGSYKNLLSNIMISHKKLLLFISCFVCSYCLYNQTAISQSYNFFCMLIALKVTFDMQKVLSMERSPLDDSLLIESLNGLDYGSGMAYSFFHGYLKLVLPDYGAEGKSFEQLISIYEASHNVTFRVKKLFVLIPHSAKCPSTLHNSELGIEESTPLQPKIITVAGVKDRVYKNSVYKILQEGINEKVYVCVEYATVIKTLYDVFNSNHRFSEIYAKHRGDIVSQFYHTLRMILKENPQCGRLCELIYYDDKLPSGRYRTDIGNILLQRMTELSHID